MQQTFPANNVQRILIEKIDGSCRIQGWDQQQIQISTQSEEKPWQEGDALLIKRCSSNLDLMVPYETVVNIQKVSGNCKVEDIRQLELHRVNGNTVLKAISGEVRFDKVDGNLHVNDIGTLYVGKVGGNLHIDAVKANVHLPAGLHVGGNLHLHAHLLHESVASLHVGGNAYLLIPVDANLTLHAIVGGVVMGNAIESNLGQHATLVYGDGAAQLNLSVGGNLELSGDAIPRSSTGNGWNWDDFGREMEHQWHYIGAEMADEITRKAEQQARRAEQEIRRAAERARHTSERAARFNVRLNEREWRMDPARINLIIEQAQQAAAEGVQGALEAVEQALKNLHVTLPPQPPMPPMPPVPPMPAKPSFTPEEAVLTAQKSSASEGTAESEPGEEIKQKEESPVSIEQEREAILRMIAEGRITPQEGDMLLEALD